jgi:abhydrolase domain-containing protein 6
MKNKLAFWLIIVMALLLVIPALLLFISPFLFPETSFNLTQKVQRISYGLVKKDIQVDDHQIAYLEGGKGETILLIHGFGANKDAWIRFTKNLTTDYHVLIPDLAGCGESSRLSKENYNYENQVKRLDRFAEVLNLNKFHIAGNSMGGAIAAVYSAKYPQKVLTLAVLAPHGLKAPKKSWWIQQMEKGSNPLIIRSEDDFRKTLKIFFVEPVSIPGPFIKVLAARAISQREFNEKIVNDIRTEHLLLDPFLPLIQAPVLIIWGDTDNILDVSGVSILEKNLKTYKTVIMKDTGHAPMLEKSGETNKSYMDFLKNKI